MEQICSLTYDFIIYQAQICHFGGQILRYLAPISQKWQILVFGLLQPQFYHRIQCLGINVQLIYMATDKIKKSAKIFALIFWSFAYCLTISESSCQPGSTGT